MDDRLTYRLIAPWGSGAGDLARSADMLAIRLPAALRPLADIAYNYRWSWLPGGPELFAAVDAQRWEWTNQNPVRLLRETSSASLERAAADEALLARARQVLAGIEADLARPQLPGRASNTRPVAFLCAEFAVHESLPQYSGGLGVLAVE